MRSYSAYFVKTDNPDELRAKLGKLNAKGVEPVPGSAWVPWCYRPNDGPPDDEIIDGKICITDQRSLQMGELIFVYADTSAELFFYEHSFNGVLLRKLVWFPMQDTEGTPGWCCVQGEPEPWELAIFRAERLPFALEQERSLFEYKNKLDQFYERETEIHKLWSEQRLIAGSSVPSGDGTLVLLVEEYFGLKRPERPQ